VTVSCPKFVSEQRHSLLFDGQHHFIELLVRQTNIRPHHLGVPIVLAELLDEFWILLACQTMKRHRIHVFPAKSQNNSFDQQIEAPLPTERITPLKPIAVTGIDLRDHTISRQGMAQEMDTSTTHKIKYSTSA
jgi:hypothetical protein